MEIGNFLVGLVTGIALVGIGFLALRSKEPSVQTTSGASKAIVRHPSPVFSTDDGTTAFYLSETGGTPDLLVLANQRNDAIPHRVISRKTLAASSPLVREVLEQGLLQSGIGGPLYEMALSGQQRKDLQDGVVTLIKYKKDGLVGSILRGKDGFEEHVGLAEQPWTSLVGPQLAFNAIAFVVGQQLQMQINEKLKTIEADVGELLEQHYKDKWFTLKSALKELMRAEALLIESGEVQLDLVNPPDAFRRIDQVWDETVGWMEDLEQRLAAAGDDYRPSADSYVETWSEFLKEGGDRIQMRCWIFIMAAQAKIAAIDLHAKIDASHSPALPVTAYRRILDGERENVQREIGRFLTFLERFSLVDFQPGLTSLSKNKKALEAQRLGRDLHRSFAEMLLDGDTHQQATQLEANEDGTYEARVIELL